jgi:multiple sugar transport system substrate-binding protein
MTTIKYLAPDTDAFVASVQRHIAEFEKKTGHSVELKILESDLYYSNRIHPYLEGGAADVFMSGPVLL